MTDRDKAYYINRIDGALSFGNFMQGSRKNVMGWLIALIVVFVAMMTFLITVLVLEHFEEPSPIEDLIFAIMGVVFGFSAATGAVVALVVVNEKNRAKILLWLEDAVPLQARSTVVQRNLMMLCVPMVKIQVEFEYDGRLHRFVSGKNPPRGTAGYTPQLGNYNDGVDVVWLKYANRTINILYSPKYKQVMVLRKEKVKKKKKK